MTPKFWQMSNKYRSWEVVREAESVDGRVGWSQVGELAGPAAEAAVRVLTPAIEAIKCILY